MFFSVLKSFLWFFSLSSPIFQHPFQMWMPALDAASQNKITTSLLLSILRIIHSKSTLAFLVTKLL